MPVLPAHTHCSILPACLHCLLHAFVHALPAMHFYAALAFSLSLLLLVCVHVPAHLCTRTFAFACLYNHAMPCLACYLCTFALPHHLPHLPAPSATLPAIPLFFLLSLYLAVCFLHPTALPTYSSFYPSGITMPVRLLYTHGVMGGTFACLPALFAPATIPPCCLYLPTTCCPATPLLPVPTYLLPTPCLPYTHCSAHACACCTHCALPHIACVPSVPACPFAACMLHTARTPCLTFLPAFTSCHCVRLAGSATCAAAHNRARSRRRHATRCCSGWAGHRKGFEDDIFSRTAGALALYRSARCINTVAAFGTVPTYTQA